MLGKEGCGMELINLRKRTSHRYEHSEELLGVKWSGVYDIYTYRNFCNNGRKDRMLILGCCLNRSMFNQTMSEQKSSV